MKLYKNFQSTTLGQPNRSQFTTNNFTMNFTSQCNVLMFLRISSIVDLLTLFQLSTLNTKLLSVLFHDIITIIYTNRSITSFHRQSLFPYNIIINIKFTMKKFKFLLTSRITAHNINTHCILTNQF